MKYLIAWTEPDNGSGFRTRQIEASSDVEAMYKLLLVVSPNTKDLTEDSPFEELEEALLEATEYGNKYPLLVFNSELNTAVFSAEDY